MDAFSAFTENPLAIIRLPWYNVHSFWIRRPIMVNTAFAAKFYFNYYFFMSRK